MTEQAARSPPCPVANQHCHLMPTSIQREEATLQTANRGTTKRKARNQRQGSEHAHHFSEPSPIADLSCSVEAHHHTLDESYITTWNRPQEADQPDRSVERAVAPRSSPFVGYTHACPSPYTTHASLCTPARIETPPPGVSREPGNQKRNAATTPRTEL